MRINRNMILWPLAAAVAIGAATAAVAVADPGPETLTEAQVNDRLAAARSSSPPEEEYTLAEDEWYAGLPSAGIVARCVGTDMQLVRWTGPNALSDVQAGPGPTVSGAVDIDNDRVTFTGRCVDGRTTGSYRWLPMGTHREPEPAEELRFGKWIASGMQGCAGPLTAAEAADPETCRRVPLLVLSESPGRPIR
ncbi:hypothetical protein [Actinoplanes sp. GCM10030250]|uniref:hypothetical protein n=1 Tax=Actinoplanes sp. GCM10030250 TaxID=3273376 RepID=UPI003616451E